jgi:type IV pilus assembly protein PilN
MARINLLPWRAERRKSGKRNSSCMLGLAAFAGLAASVPDLQLLQRADQRPAGAQRLPARRDRRKVEAKIKEIEELDQKKNQAAGRKEVIEQLQANRSQMVHLFDSLVRTIPDGVILSAIKQEGDKLTLRAARSRTRG